MKGNTSSRAASYAAAAVTMAAAVALAGCSSDDGGGAGSGASASGTSTAAHRTLVVDAAASLTATFQTIADQFEQANPGVDVKLSFAGSQDLEAQIEEGAPVDVFASADEPTMKKLAGAHLVEGTAQDFASNVLTIVTPPDNPAGISSFAGLGSTKGKVVVCAPQVPCGNATKEIEKATGVTIHPASEESSVTDVLAKITSGQADAGLVYVTDAQNALATKPGSIERVDFPESKDAVNTYPIAEVKGSKEDALAKAFVAQVMSTQGQTVLTKAGFGAP
jgi:molybdate transport system substrate-binding protein